MVIINVYWYSPSKWDGKVEDREHHSPFVVCEQVSNDGWRDG